MVSELVCPCHTNMVDTYIGKHSSVILKYSNSYNGYWKGEDVEIKLQYTHTNLIKIDPGCLPLYVFENSENHHTIAMDYINACKLNLKDGG